MELQYKSGCDDAATLRSFLKILPGPDSLQSLQTGCTQQLKGLGNLFSSFLKDVHFNYLRECGKFDRFCKRTSQPHSSKTHLVFVSSLMRSALYALKTLKSRPFLLIFIIYRFAQSSAPDSKKFREKDQAEIILQVLFRLHL